MKVTQSIEKIDAGDLHPLTVYEKLCAEDSYILESAEGGEKIARYSIIGVNPALKFSFQNGKIKKTILDENLSDLKLNEENPLQTLRTLVGGLELNDSKEGRFTGGPVGYFSYDFIRHFVDLPEGKKDVLNEPDCEFILARDNIVFDHVEKKISVISSDFGDASDCNKRAENIIEKLHDVDYSNEDPPAMKGKVSFTSNQTKEEFETEVEKAREYIREGDIFQVVLSQRLTADFNGDTLDVYRLLKKINPSPYMYYINFGDRKIVGSSPEMLTRVDGKTVVTYPIAGTRSRGKNPREDKELMEDMLASEKERAEHVMLVDLGRNDVGRVAEFGSVSVPKFMGVEKYSHVQHMVSEVVGTLREDKDCFDAFESIFPAGTVSGAPKVRAMEIIDELEPDKRGVYAGAIGYFSLNGNMDTAITIRTIVFEGNKAHVQAGAGIVADSVPEQEYKETLKKAKALINSLSI